MVGLDDLKVKINRFYPHTKKKKNRPWYNSRRCVLVYISFEFDYKSNLCGYNVFLSLL